MEENNCSVHGNCTLCSSPCTNKSTYPLNIMAKNPDVMKHPNAGLIIEWDNEARQIIESPDFNVIDQFIKKTMKNYKVVWGECTSVAIATAKFFNDVWTETDLYQSLQLIKQPASAMEGTFYLDRDINVNTDSDSEENIRNDVSHVVTVFCFAGSPMDVRGEFPNNATFGQTWLWEDYSNLFSEERYARIIEDPIWQLKIELDAISTYLPCYKKNTNALYDYLKQKWMSK